MFLSFPTGLKLCHIKIFPYTLVQYHPRTPRIASNLGSMFQRVFSGSHPGISLSMVRGGGQAKDVLTQSPCSKFKPI